jgi:hypothetical protein
MRRGIARLRGLGFILWQTRHEFYHVLVGLTWAWFLRELWHEFNVRWIGVAIIGSLLPDLDHFIYFLTYGKRDWYTKQVRTFLREHEWRTLWKFVASGHKYNTSLATHNYFFMAFLVAIAILSFFYDFKTGVILFGAMFLHYLFDILDDIVALGYVNENWRRFWKPKRF